MLRLDRAFRAVIVTLTTLAVVALVAGTSTGRFLASRAWHEARLASRDALGLPPDRAEIEADTALRRGRGIAQTSATFRDIYAEASPPMKRLLDYAGLEPRDAVLRWGNVDRIFLLPSTVFRPDDTGRSYRMRPDVRSIWLRKVALPRGLDGFFLVPDRPELREVLDGTGAGIVPGSEQTTNSWGCRGPEPDVDAPVRGLILGDSNMQGLFVGDDETPPERLRRDLESRLNVRVSLLNTGHLGYSPEQFFHALTEYANRFRPHFVILSLCANDFGDVGETLAGRVDLREGHHWIEQIDQFCRVRNIICVTSPVPNDHQVTGLRREGAYPGRISDLLRPSSLHYCYPIEDLVDEFLRLRLESARSGSAFPANPLYNCQIDDHHMSPLGTSVWGRALGRRVAVLLEGMRLKKEIAF
jgi:hypothetical protein